MKNLNFYSVLLSLCLLFGLNNNANSQISHGGTPPSFTEKSISNNYELREFSKPDMKKITEQDEENAGKKDVLRRIAVSIQANLNTKNSGTWTNLPDGSGRIWRLKIKSKDALALGIYYNNFYLPKGGKLFLYNKNKTQVIGAFTEQNNPENKFFATELIRGETVTIEYFEPKKVLDKAIISISEIAYIYRDVYFLFKNGGKDFGDSDDDCEVNINCSPEGSNWQDEKKGVARILIKAGTSYGWCSGSLVNNTNQDLTPYFLTADHCGDGASSSDLNQWKFYFNYEGTTCSNPSSEPSYNSIVGGTLKAHGGDGGDTGSDFFLLELSSSPSGAYYNGWNNVNSASSGGVSIHHPYGDIKKISTYTTSLASTQWNSNGLSSHWLVYWASTTNGQGVTEGGSSGSPLFDNNGRIVGTLTGGSSSCASPTDPDAYGKFSYHWLSNGSTVAEQLKPWLDPTSTGATTLDGTYTGGVVPLTAAFIGTPTSGSAPLSVQFTDQSSGSPTSWSWTFGDGGTSTIKNPNHIYNSDGTYTVSLTVNDGSNNDTETKSNYITVSSGGNPAAFTLDFESCADFALTFDPWTVNDVDASTTYGIENVTFTNQNEAMAFIAFNPSQTDPSMTSMITHGGSRLGASFAAQTAPNNDWLISSKVQLGTNSSISFWVKSYTDQYGLERYNVAVSTTDNNPSSFTVISGSPYQEAPVAAWTQKTFSLSAYNNQQVYIAIQCVSNDAFIFMIDDISINTTSSVMTDNYTENSIKIYPNPANDIINIDLGNNPTKDTKIKIYNTIGELVYSSDNIKSKNIQINMSNNSRGLYFINIQTPYNEITRKISLIK